MPRYTQADRPMRVDTVLDEDVLLLQAFSGREGVSTPYHYDVQLLSEDPELSARDLLRTPLLLTVFTPTGEKRFVHGLVKSFTELHRREDFTHYRAEIVPWFWFLSLARDCRIFQEMNVLDIIEQVFSDLGWSDFEVRCNGSYPTREYCVQYRETSLDFVSRLMEEEGIFYFFEHGESKHVLVLADGNTAFKPCPSKETARMATEAAPDEDVVTSLERHHSVHSEKVTLQDYDFLQPSLPLLISAAGEDGEEVYDFPGGYTELDQGDRYARLRLEQRELEGEVVKGDSTCRAFRSGYRFELKDHHRPDTNAEYVLTTVHHSVVAGDYRSWEGAELDYENRFVAVPYAVPYRPPLTTPSPRIHGTQTALVVGPSGEEVWVDKHGRIKVQFYWDREGEKNENSSCWIRVAMPWAGKGWGAVSLPRIGNEVVVGFEEGDPDRPLVVGSVYNAEQTPPFDLPDADIQMGMKSRSSPGGGGHNEISMTDTKGEEKITIHAQYDMDTKVLNDQGRDIGNNRTTSVAVDDTESVGSNQTMDVGADQTLSVGGNQTIDVGGDRSDSVGGNEDASVGGNRSADVGGNDELTIGGNGTVSAGINHETSTGANWKVSAGAMGEVNAAASIKITAGATITLSAGGSTVEIGPAGVTISTGAMIALQGSMIKLN